ncbi:MAG: aldehyde dehydrogenase family protein, partial [Gammaproteobacteria bacterium]|nr:aldehyde dehydrogenase family protein [Gammaproteobacteria bacterium]
AIQQANALPFSFQASVFTNSLDTAMRVYKRIDASAVMLNDHTAFRIDGMPCAGLKQSGLGVGGIPYTIEDMQVNKMLVMNSPEL